MGPGQRQRAGVARELALSEQELTRRAVGVAQPRPYFVIVVGAAGTRGVIRKQCKKRVSVMAPKERRIVGGMGLDASGVRPETKRVMVGARSHLTSVETPPRPRYLP